MNNFVNSMVALCYPPTHMNKYVNMCTKICLQAVIVIILANMHEICH